MAEGKYSLIQKAVEAKLGKFAEENRESIVRAELARLRRGVGKKPGELPELWGSIFLNWPIELESKKNEASYEEWAVYNALTLYAMHQQGRNIKTDNMHRKGVPIGSAAAILSKQDSSSESAVVKRFNTLATSAGIIELTWHLKSFIQLLRQKDIGLDYTELAKDIYAFQFDDSKASIRLKWGRDFYGEINRKNDSEKEKENE